MGFMLGGGGLVSRSAVWFRMLIRPRNVQKAAEMISLIFAGDSENMNCYMRTRKHLDYQT